MKQKCCARVELSVAINRLPFKILSMVKTHSGYKSILDACSESPHMIYDKTVNTPLKSYGGRFSCAFSNDAVI